jgi:lysozyme
MDPLHLPDVSEYQPNVNWKDVAARNGGAAIIRAMYGADHVDNAWYGGARRANAHEEGIQVLGIYQFFVPTQDPIAQAEALVRLLGHLRPGEFVIADVETGEGNLLGPVERWLEYVDQHLTYPGYSHAWVYSNAAFWAPHGLMPIADSKRHTWVAAYGSTPPSVPHTLWQHTDSEQWPGIGPCDCSIFNGDVGRFRKVIAG